MAEFTPQELLTVDFAVREHRSLWMDAWRRLISGRTARMGMIIVVTFVLSAVLSHYFWIYNASTDLDYSLKLKPPNLTVSEEIPSIHLFGTDKLGRDIFRRTIHGGWNSMRVGLVAVGISMLTGVLLGLLAGFYESMQITSLERILLQSLAGVILGTLPAWLAAKWPLALAFGLLGTVSVLIHRQSKPRISPRIIFGALGALIGALGAVHVGSLAALVCGVLGAFAGLILAYPLSGNFFSNVVMRVMDIILSFPSYLLAIAIVAFLGPGLEKGMIAIGVVGIPVYARLTRSAVLSVSQKEYVLAARSVGEGHGRIIFKHILPNILSPLIVQATMGLASAILSAAALGFLGLGAIPPEPEWGAMLGDSYKYLSSGAWWAVLFPGLAIMLSVLGFNLLGDGLRDALDPKLRI
jgi:ABC-type dipeptide/oligopeptide/nickel transport system permease subunit